LTNLELAWVLTEMGDLLEIKGEDSFKVRAYYRAARVLESMEVEASDLYARGALEEIPGVGKNLAKKIAELISTGHSTFLDNLRREVPPGLREMLAIPGLGSRSVRQIYQGLGVKTLEELETAAREKRIRTLPGMGSKTEQAILRGLDMLREVKEQVPLGIARPLALNLRQQLLALPGVDRAEIAGSVRRGCEMVGDVDIVAAVRPGNQVAEVIARNPQVKEVLASEPERLSLQTYLGVKIEIILVEPDKFWATLLYATGSRSHRKRLLERVAARGLTAAGIGLDTPRWLQEEAEVINGGRAGKEDKQNEAVSSIESDGCIDKCEESIFYCRLDLPYIVPELREDRGEIEAAGRRELPRLVKLEDIRGDLHIHTNYSDGVGTIGEMVEAARKRGYSYLAITDHSRSLVIARGLSLEQIKVQRAEITGLNEKYDDFTVLSGIEVDILPDGSLDYDDDVLQEFDLVIASIHRGFRQEEDQIMKRLEAAMRHPYVDILGHPTGRMLGRRKPYAVNVAGIIELAAETGTILEINASPDRLDLNDESVRIAKDLGVPVAINTDAHDPGRLGEMLYGVITARRGWLEPENVVNTWELPELLSKLKRNRRDNT